MADPLFSLRGVLTPRRNEGIATRYTFATSTITSSSDGGALSGNLIDFTNSTANKGLWYSGRKNTPASRSQSYLIRIKANYTGAPAANRILFTLTGGNAGVGPLIQFYHAVTTGNIIGVCRNQANSACLNSVSFGAWTGITSGTYYDLFFTWGGTTGANSAKFYIDAVSLGTVTPGNALESSWDTNYYANIIIGGGPNVTTSDFKLDEFCIWDGAINPTSVTLESGSGSLNGASRTSLVAAAALDGSITTGTAASNILSTASIVIDGVTTTGTYVAPVNTNVKTGVSFGVSDTGTYDGSDRHTDPGIANVRSGTAYKSNSTTNNRTGTCAVPAAADVRNGTSVDATTGTCYVPAASNVLSGVNVDNTTGTAVVPSANDVRSGVAVAATTGNLIVPPVYTVLKDYPYDSSGGTVGTLTVVPPTVVVLPLG